MNIYEKKNIGDILAECAYPGRGIVTGLSENGRYAAFAYFIMGRSGNSRNRVFRSDGETVTIYPFDESKVSDPSLIIYSPVRKVGQSPRRYKRRPDRYGVQLPRKRIDI